MTRPTVLVVEDQEQLAELYETWLSGDYDVATAYSASEATELLDGIDVALLDRRLPDGSGDDVLEQIRERDIDARVAMVTAVDPDFDILEMGFDDYVVKPIDKEELLELVSGLLDRRQYSNDVQRFYSLASKRAMLEAEKSVTELDETEAYNALLEELEELEASLEDRTVGLSDDDYEALFHEL